MRPRKLIIELLTHYNELKHTQTRSRINLKHLPVASGDNDADWSNELNMKSMYMWILHKRLLVHLALMNNKM